jgi:hypothetical protein
MDPFAQSACDAERDEKQPPRSSGHAGGVRFVLRILMPACIVHWTDMVLECGTCDHEWPPGALRTRIVVRAGFPVHERRGRRVGRRCQV